MADNEEKSGVRRRRLVVAGVAVVVAVLGLYFWDDYHPSGSIVDTPAVQIGSDPLRNDPTRDPPAPPEATAILTDLKVGSSVAGWTITALTISTKNDMNGALAVPLTNGKKSFVVWIMPKAKTRLFSSHETDRYSFHAGMFVETQNIETTAPLDALVKRVRAFEGSPEAPASVASCVPGSESPSASAPPPSSDGPAKSAAPAPGR
jgi:hypothetical protein